MDEVDGRKQARPTSHSHSLLLRSETMKIAHYYRKTEPSHSLLPSVREELKVLGLEAESAKITVVETESCFNVLVVKDLAAGEQEKLEWLLAETFDRDALQLEVSSLKADGSSFLFEFGPRLTFTSAFSSNATSICQACALDITRLELSRRYRFVVSSPLSDDALATVKSMLYDRMTEEEYAEPLQSFDSGASPKPIKTIPIMSEGRAALEKINKEMGLGFDDFDLDYYTNLFKVGRTPCGCMLALGFGRMTNLYLSFLAIPSGETGARSYRCGMLRHGTVQLRAFPSLVLWRKDGDRRG
jgi:phosphoribosylformylglycinamidine synthase